MKRRIGLRGGFKAFKFPPLTPRMVTALDKHKPKVQKKLKEIFPGMPGHAASVGIEILHGLMKMQGAKASPLAMSGAVVSSPATGSITKTVYKSRHKGSRMLKNLSNLGSRGEYITFCDYRLSADSLNSQASGDMYTGSANATSQGNLIAAIYPGTVWDTTGARPGIFSAAQQQLQGNTTTGILYPWQNTARVFHKFCDVRTMISNIDNIPVVVTIYEVVAKHDMTSFPLFNNPSSLDTSVTWQHLSPSDAWYAGMKNLGAAGSDATISSLTLGSRPYDSELFNTYWKVCSCVDVELSVGSVHQHTSSYQINRVISGQRPSYSSMLQGITRNIMIVVRGSPVTFVGDTSKVAIGTSGINVTHEITYKWASVSPSSKLYSTYINNEPVSSNTTEAETAAGVAQSPAGKNLS
jgi:hypothetical protein